MKKIKLDTQKNIVFIEQKEISYTTDEIDLISVTDNGTSVTAIISVNGESKCLILWEGTDYSEIGQWTDNDVKNILNEIL
mgnify:CR=1 FL=1